MKLVTLLKVTFWKGVAAVLLTVGGIAAYQRFTYGLGATSHLNDYFPWGLWIAFDFIGVGLAAAGFTIAATVHIFNVHRFRPIVRPAILTACAGYMLVVLLLIVDLGRPENFWHPLVMWNPHSVMFEITWCIILYTSVLLIEFAPVVLEKFNLNAPIKVLRIISLPVVIAGVILSTLHQSSFGSLYLLMPGRMHPLWYSSIIPLLFLISCISAGLSMVIVESFLSGRILGREIELRLLSELAKVVVVVLALYFIVRVQDLMGRDAFHYVFEPSYQRTLFIGEMLLGVVAPFALLLFEKVRTSKVGLFYSSILVLLGFIVHRLNTAITSMEQWPDRMYLPSWQEISITLGLVAFGFVAFSVVARYFKVFDQHAPPKTTVKKEANLLEEAPSFSQ